MLTSVFSSYDNMHTMPGINFSHAKSSSSKTCSFPLKAIIFVVVIIINIFCSNAEANPRPSGFSKLSRSSFSSACNGIPYKSACESVLVSLKNSDQSSIPTTPKDLFDHSLHYTFKQARSALELASTVSLPHHINPSAVSVAAAGGGVGGMIDCIELLDDSLDLLSNVINRKSNPKHTHNDIQTWLSAALTNQETCIESLENDNFNLYKGQEMTPMARNLSQHLSNSLALYMSHHYYEKDSNNHGRKLLSGNDKFPAWVSETERKLLETPATEIRAHAVVAQDGSGTHKSIGEAIAEVTNRYTLAGEGGGGRTVIYIKAGTYNENLKLPTKQKDVMLVGDGKGKSVIIGSKSADAGYSTFQTATVSVMGDGFIAKGITFVNSAGPSKHQAVALTLASDKSVIYQCSLQGYQDTLYTHSKRQFYRETDISGTVDFIFGNSAVVFQNCNIFARKPSGERNYVTAQGRIDPNQNTGISIHKCRITSESSGSKITYLGRPWKKYSRVVIMQSFLDGSINPAGWFPWSGGFALSTLYYGEFMNSGPGSSTLGRVNWSGYKGMISAASAQTFTVGNFIDGNLWLPSTGVSFDSGLIG